MWYFIIYYVQQRKENVYNDVVNIAVCIDNIKTDLKQLSL